MSSIRRYVVGPKYLESWVNSDGEGTDLVISSVITHREGNFSSYMNNYRTPITSPSEDTLVPFYLTIYYGYELKDCLTESLKTKYALVENDFDKDSEFIIKLKGDIKKINREYLDLNPDATENPCMFDKKMALNFLLGKKSDYSNLEVDGVRLVDKYQEYIKDDNLKSEAREYLTAINKGYSPIVISQTYPRQYIIVNNMGEDWIISTIKSNKRPSLICKGINGAVSILDLYSLSNVISFKHRGQYFCLTPRDEILPFNKLSIYCGISGICDISKSENGKDVYNLYTASNIDKVYDVIDDFIKAGKLNNNTEYIIHYINKMRKINN